MNPAIIELRVRQHLLDLVSSSINLADLKNHEVGCAIDTAVNKASTNIFNTISNGVSYE